MSNANEDRLCREVEERIAELLNGDADPTLLEHIAGCDRCRDLRFDAMNMARDIVDAGVDYQHPADFEAQLLAKLAAREDEDDAPVAAPAANVIETPDPAPWVPTAPSAASSATAVEPVAAAPTPTVVDEPAPVAAAETRPMEPAVEAVTAAPKRSAAEEARVVEAKPLAPVITSDTRPKPVVRGRGKVIGLTVAGVAALAAAAGLAMYVRSGADTPTVTDAKQAWQAQVASVKVAGLDRTGGLQQCSANGADCQPVAEGVQVKAGALLRTDARTRVQLEMSDGTRIAIDRATEVSLGDEAGRVARLEKGAIVADVAHLDDGPGARIDVPNGKVEVLGTKFHLTVTEDRSDVEVVRGSVRLSNDEGRAVVVRAGEEGSMTKESDPNVMPAATLGEGLVWSERTDVEDGPEEAAVRGLGELRARKPGSKGELNQAVRLTKHDVKVRVVGAVARTEIDETFSNDTGDVLEGIYRFPLPPDAQIERLALEVDGKMEEGAFVDKDRAAAIWRGVMVAAAPRSPKPREEIIWVPGPWHDPALLEWQRGGRFELRIYPIPAKGARRVVLAYTQTIQPSGGVRRYTYPLSYDPSGSTKVDDFRVDVQVRGHRKDFGVRSRGYAFDDAGGSDGAKSMTMHAKSFVPSGDITLEYALAEDDREVTAWAYRSASKPADADETDKDAKDRTKDDAPAEAADNGAYVAIALRPRLPRWSEGKFRDQVIVVDASRSMVGERYKRASRLAESVVREMDRRDRFTVLACDTTCEAMTEGMMAPGGAAAQKVRDFLSTIEPEGGSDLVESVRQARKAADRDAEARELRIIYVGDGTPSVGPVRPPHIMQEVARVLPPGSGMLTAVAVGADADSHSMAAMARGGGGVMIPYVPGEQTGAVAMRVLGASYGIALRNPMVELPEGLTAVYPKMLDNIPAGGESIVVARMSRSGLSGQIKLRGKVGGDKYEQSFPIELSASDAKGNAFVPRLYAATKIADLEANQGESAKKELIELSKTFAVASRYTSLLVLESAAMFRAFGIDRNASGAPMWTGEEESRSTGADGLTRYDAADEESDGDLGFGGEDKKKDRAEKSSAGPGYGAGRSNPYGDDAVGGASETYARPPSATPKPAATAAAPPRKAPATMAAPPADEPWGGARDRRRGGMVPMRRVWDRKGDVSSDYDRLISQAIENLNKAESDVSANPDSRTRLEKLLGLYAVAGRVDRAAEIAERWAERDALDPGALIARAEVAARMGDRKRAIRILGGLADVRPGDGDTQKWLASLNETMGDDYRACSHRIALAGLKASDAEAVAEAVRCARVTQRDVLATTLLSDVTSTPVRARVDRELAKSTTDRERLRGDVRVEATWDADVDLDVALIGKNGQRYSWLGDPKGRVSARDATSNRSETLALFNAPSGEYLVEMTRANPGDDDVPVRGQLRIRAAGTSRSIPFVMSGARTSAGRIRVYYTSHLEPVPGW